MTIDPPPMDFHPGVEVLITRGKWAEHTGVVERETECFIKATIISADGHPSAQVNKNSCVRVEAVDSPETPIATRVRPGRRENETAWRRTRVPITPTATPPMDRARFEEMMARYPPTTRPRTPYEATRDRSPDTRGWMMFDGPFGRVSPAITARSATRLATVLDNDEEAQASLTLLCSRLALYGFDSESTVVYKCISDQLDASHRALEEGE
jgi:hypothetical protein